MSVDHERVNQIDTIHGVYISFRTTCANTMAFALSQIF